MGRKAYLTDKVLRLHILEARKGDWTNLTKDIQLVCTRLKGSVGKDTTESEDIAQESFLAVFTNLDKFDLESGKSCFSYLTSIILNTMRHFCRKSIQRDRLRANHTLHKLGKELDTNIKDGIRKYLIETTEVKKPKN